MATVAVVKAKVGQDGRRNEYSALLHEPICGRCGGLMVRDFCTDLLTSSGELDCATARCVQCGDVVDPVIRQNRQLQQMRGMVQEMKASGSSTRGRVSV